jgi:hypothetical protein
MTTPHDSVASEALLTDAYLDALLAGALLDAAARTDGTAPAGPASLDPAVREVGDRLRRDLVRVHPSFRFEERLATRLAEAALALRLPVAVGSEGRVVPFRADGSEHPGAPATALSVEGHDGVDGSTIGPRAAASAAAAVDVDRRAAGRPLLIGGALTSAAISIAGAAWVAWRRTRPTRSVAPMVRAARVVRDARRTGRRAVSAGAGGRGAARRTSRGLD